MTEQDIIYERGSYWVCRDRDRYSVMKNAGTHSIADSCFRGDEKGRLLSIARCDYMASREALS